MLDVCLLGCGGMMPLPRRALTALMIRYQGKSILVDCGEGTQVSIRQQGWSFHSIDAICFTHFHADHISGLPGLLLSIGNAERTEPLILIGPKRLEYVVNALRVIAPGLPFEIEYRELEEDEEEFEVCGIRVNAFKVNHSITCYGYTFNIDRAGKFDPERAKAADIPLQLWGRLQKGETVSMDGRTYTPDMVLGAPRKGIRLTYCTDTRPLPVIARYAKSSDLFICEGMYGEDEKLDKAKENRHMTMYEAAEMARAAQPKEMWLTHYSPSLIKPKQYLERVQRIFPNTQMGKDRMETVLRFEE